MGPIKYLWATPDFLGEASRSEAGLTATGGPANFQKVVHGLEPTYGTHQIFMGYAGFFRRSIQVGGGFNRHRRTRKLSKGGARPGTHVWDPSNIYGLRRIF